ncbi:MAG: hypothetical protein WBD40_06310 [Tepidisphaeraceae bacterium]
MAAIVPNTASRKISFFSTHVPVWAEDPSGIGTTAERVALVQSKVDAARAALLARDQAFSAARSATLRLKTALAELGDVGGQVIGEIKAKAGVDGSEIYYRARLRTPADPSPIGKPGKTSSLSVELSGDGSLRLSWKCKHPRGAKGTMYQVYRALGYDGEPVFLGATGKKKFTDATIPAGTRTVIYRIVAVRSTARGSVAEFPVNLGVSGKMPAQFLPRDQFNAAA